MKRFLQKSYFWLATLLLAVAFAVSGSAQAAKAIEFPATQNNATKDGVTVSAAWWTGSQFNVYGDLDSEWGYLKVTSALGNIVKVEFSGPSGMNTITCTNGALTSATGTSSTWEGNTDEVIFHSSDDVYVNSLTVYVDEGNGGATEEAAIEFPATQNNITKDGVSISAAWWTGSQFNVYGDLDSEWGYLKVASASGNITKIEFYGPSGMNTITCTNGALTSATSTFSTWEGDTDAVTFHSSDDVYIDKLVVYINKSAAPAKECTIDVDHFTDNAKPGKLEYLPSNITLYMQANAMATLWTGSDNCPEGVTLTGEDGQSYEVRQLNTWMGSDQIGIVFRDGIETPGVYTLHIPEGIVLFEGKKWNKEINVEWTVVAPDLREKKEVTFDLTADAFATTVEGVTVATNGAYNENAGAVRLGASNTITFTAPEGTKIVKIQFINNSGFYQGNYSMLLTVPQGIGESDATSTLFTWQGDEQSVTFQAGAAICISNAVVTLAIEENTQPEVDPAESAYHAWKELVMNEMKAVKEEWGEAPDTDVPGKKPANVVAYVVNYYNSISWLFGYSGFGDDWTAAKEYYSYYGSTIEANYAEALQIWQAYLDAELVPEGVDPTYTEPVLKAEDVSAEVAYYIFTDARGGLTVDGEQLKGTKEVGQDVNPADVHQQFAFVNWEGNLYLYSLAAEKFIGKANRGNFTEEPVDPIYFKNAGANDVMLYFDDSFNFNLGGSNQVTIDGWKQKDPGNSFHIMVAEKFDQTALLEKLAGGGEVIDPVDPVEPTDLSIFAGEWYFKGEGAYLNYYEENLTPKDEYTVNITVENGKLYMTDLVGFVYDTPNAFIGTYDAEIETLIFTTPYADCYVVDDNYEYYTNFQPLVFNVVKDENGKVSLVNNSGWNFMYEDWYYTTYDCGYTSCTMTREKQIVEPEPEPEGWNGNILYPETAANLNDLLSYTIEFEEAKTVEASGYDVLGVIFDETGDPYAIAIANGVFDAYGSISFNGGKATVNFMKISDLTPKAQDSVFLHIARINGFTQPAGHASVVFASKSFKVDGELIYDTLQKDYVLGENGVTGIDTIATDSNDSIYDLNGRRVNSVRSGLYIKNGVKVFMK